MSIKNFSDTIGNRTRDLPACNAVSQPTAPPCAPMKMLVVSIITDVLCCTFIFAYVLAFYTFSLVINRIVLMYLNYYNFCEF